MNQRGFSQTIIIFTVAGLIIIGAIGYFIMNRQISLPTPDTPSTPVSQKLVATPTSGSAPLKVMFSWSGYEVPPREPCPVIDYGDGSRGESIDSCPTSSTYTYTRPGTYEVKLSQTVHTCPVTYEQVQSGQPQGCPILKSIGAITIVVH